MMYVICRWLMFFGLSLLLGVCCLVFDVTRCVLCVVCCRLLNVVAVVVGLLFGGFGLCLFVVVARCCVLSPFPFLFDVSCCFGVVCCLVVACCVVSFVVRRLLVVVSCWRFSMYVCYVL